MDNQQHEKSFQLTLPADKEFVLVARMALSGFGMLAGLDVDLLDDLRTITDECCDCLTHQMVLLQEIQIFATIKDQKLECRFCGVRGTQSASHVITDTDITRCILETLVPYVQLHCDESGVCCIEFSMAA